MYYALGPKSDNFLKMSTGVVKMKKEERRVRRVFAPFDKEIVPLAESFTLFLFRATR